MKIIIITITFCTCLLFSMHNPSRTQREIQDIWYVQQMKHLHKWVDLQKDLSDEQYAFYTKQRNPATEVITKKGDILQR